LKNKIVDIVCLCLVGAVFGSVALLNVVQPNRPTESEIENRNLAEFPEFSVKTLADGSYFSDLSVFISDTFIYRDQLVGLSKKLDTLRGVNYSISSGDKFVVLDPGGNKNDDEEDDLNDKINSALEDLLNQGNKETDKPSDTTPPIDPDTQNPDGEIVDYETDPIEESDTDPSGSSDNTETDPAESDTSDTDPIDSETPSDETDPPEIVNAVTAIHLSKSTIKLTVGTGATISATQETTTGEGEKVQWSISDSSVAQISLKAKGVLDIKALSAGRAVITCSWKGKVKATCEVIVSEVTVAPPQTDEKLDHLPNGMFIYGDAVYTQGYFSQNAATSYAQTALYYKRLFGDNVRVSTVVIPVSSMVIDNPEVTSGISDQKVVLDKMEAVTDPAVNFVNVYNEMYAHRDEYLYFKSDHHWTQRGAYYAYKAFAESIGLKPTPLTDFNFSIINDHYNGSLYGYTHDERVKSFIDVIEAFTPKKNYTMTVTSSKGTTTTTDSVLSRWNSTYASFIHGDNPYTVINVPENPQDKNVLVLKDSFGNAFVPFLCEHYGNIFVVDVRHSSFNIYEQLSESGITDIIFINNVQQANTASWSKMYLKAVGVNID